MSPTDPINKESVALNIDSLRTQTYNQIKKMILTNQLLPGQPIIIDQIVKQLGVSQTPFREAIGMLEIDGLVVVERYKNTRVSEITSNDVREVYEMRILLEGWAVEQATHQIPINVLEDLENQQNEVRSEISESTYDRFLEIDLYLHNTITGIISNRMFSRMLQLLSNQSTRIRSLVEATRSLETQVTIIDEHLSILKALISRDSQVARQNLITHLESAKNRTLISLEILVKKESALR